MRWKDAMKKGVSAFGLLYTAKREFRRTHGTRTEARWGGNAGGWRLGMYEIDGICYAGTSASDVRIVEARPLRGGMLLVSFSSGEQRLFDTTAVEGGAFAPLRDGTAQDGVAVRHGFVTWLNGTIDLAPEYVYARSTPYDSACADRLLVG